MDLMIGEAQNLVDTMKYYRSGYLQTWKETAAFISPNRFKNNPLMRNTGQRKDHKILKNRARLSLRTFVSGMMNGATPQSRPWFKATVANQSKSKNTQAKRFFADIEKTFNSHYQMSNLYRILPMAYKDVGLFSNAAYAMLPHQRYGFYFYPFAIGSFGMANDSEGNVNTFFRDFTLSVRQIVEQYGALKPNGHIDWSKMDPWVRMEWDNQRYLSIASLTNLILPNKNPKPNMLDSKHKMFQSYTWLNATAMGIPPQSSRGFRNEAGHNLEAARGEPDFSGFLSIRGYDYFPVITPRWELEPEEDYGCDGPAEIAIGDVMSLQRMERDRLEAVAKMVRPPMIGPASLRRHQSTILAGGMTYIDDMSAASGAKFQPAFMVDGKISELLLSQADLEGTIRTAFYEDLFLMLANERMTSHVTAAEINERSAEKMNALSPVLGQLDQDQNGRIFDNAYIILSAQNRLPPIPKILQGEELRPEYTSVLAQAAKMSQVNSIERFINFTSSMANTLQDPSLLKIPKAEIIVREYGDYVGIDPLLVSDEREMEEVRAVTAQEQAMARNNAMLAQEAETAKNLSQAKLSTMPDERSMLDEMVG